MVGRPPVLIVLGGLFAVSALGRAVAALSGPAPEDLGPPSPGWSELDAWSAELDAREQDVEAAGIAADILSAEAQRMAREAETGGAPAADPARARRLAALYAAMPPERAADVLSPMGPERVAAVLDAMAPAAAGAVMAAMEADAARAVGAALAE